MRAVCPETGDTGVREVVFRGGGEEGVFTTEVTESTEDSRKQSFKQTILNAEVAGERRGQACAA